MRAPHPARVRAAVGRAELVRLVAELPPDRAARAAAQLGFEAPDERPAPRRAPTPAAVAPGLATPAEPLARREAAPVPFWRMEEMTFTDAPDPSEATPLPPPGEPLRDDELSGTGSLYATPRTAPLAAWSRLWPVLRAALQSSAPGRDPDVPALLRAWARGQVVRRVPRAPRRVWADRGSVWIDRTQRLVPFWSDQADVCRRLRAACGSGLQVRVLDAPTQAWSMARRGDLLSGFRADPQAPVLVLGDLAAYDAPVERAAWRITARRLRAAGVALAALVPAPPARWDAAAAKAWGAVPWERGPTAGAAAARRSPDFWQARAERCLRLMAPAAFVQPGLLRALRRLLPASQADAATEADAWRHADVSAADATGLVLHAEAAIRWRQRFADEVDAALKARVRDAIRSWHEGLPKELLRAETLAWHAMVPPEVVAEPPGDRDDALRFAARFEASLRRGAGHAGRLAVAVRRCARSMLPSMPVAAYQAVPALKIAWAVAFQGVAGVRLPAGIEPAALYEALAGAGAPRWWAARQVGGELVFNASPGAAWPSQERGPGSPVAWLLAAGAHLFVKRGEEAFETQLVLAEGLRVPLPAGEGLSLRSDRCAVTLGCWTREPWAVAAGRDRFGLWAEAEVQGIAMRFRWIPPGRFVMGSPAGEAGRFDAEGPQHAVTWTRGRWLCDAPVTQALWQAVMGSNPSRFSGAERPVEQVSWEDCQKFLLRANALAPGLGARLPSEAEWEHACRAGTAAATWLGDLEYMGESNAPLLETIARYDGNSGRETHAVKGKDPNPLGLFDMLGNVYEWCLDAYASRYVGEASVTDPPPSMAGSRRVHRGGSWSSYARIVRAAIRNANLPGLRYADLGFRLARGQEPGKGAEPGPRSGPRNRDAGRGPVSAPARDAPPGAKAIQPARKGKK